MSDALATTSIRPQGATRRLCVACGHPNHFNARACSKCGESSWKAATKALPPSDEDPGDAHQPPVPRAQAAAPAPVNAPELTIPPVLVEQALHTSRKPVSVVDEPTYIVERDFRQLVGNVTVHLERGKLLSDQNLIAILKSMNAPIRLIGEEAYLVRCPDCGGLFDLGPRDGEAKH